MESFLDYLALVTALIVVVLILLQTRGASLGAGLGGGGETGGSVRRGSELSVHRLTVILVVVFAVSLVAGLLLA